MQAGSLNLKSQNKQKTQNNQKLATICFINLIGFEVQLCTKVLGDYITGTSTVSTEKQTLLTLGLPKTTKKFPQMIHLWLQRTTNVRRSAKAYKVLLVNYTLGMEIDTS